MEKSPYRIDRNTPGSAILSAGVQFAEGASGSVNFAGAAMSKLLCVTITLAGLLAFSFAAFAKGVARTQGGEPVPISQPDPDKQPAIVVGKEP